MMMCACGVQVEQAAQLAVRTVAAASGQALRQLAVSELWAALLKQQQGDVTAAAAGHRSAAATGGTTASLPRMLGALKGGIWLESQYIMDVQYLLWLRMLSGA
jgi:hypothetical protein